MLKPLLSTLLIATALPAFAQQDRYLIRETNPYSPSYGAPREIEMRNRFDPDPSKRFRGEVENDGSVRMRNLNGERLRGHVDEDGYGRLRDQDGNTYRVKPR